MVEHYHGAHSGPYVVKASCLHILEDDWNKYQAEFEAAVKRSEKYRAASIVKEHLQSMTEDDQRLLYEELKKKFE